MILSPSANVTQRRLLCGRCGTAFDCGAGTDHCWCADETFRMPMPTGGGDCLCQSCLRAAASAPASGRTA